MLRYFLSFIKDAEPDSIENRMRSLIIVALLLHTLSFMVLSAAGIFYTHSLKKALSGQIGLGMRRNLITGDLRQAILDAEVQGSRQFLSIGYFREGKMIFALPADKAIDWERRYRGFAPAIRYGRIDYPIFLDETNRHLSGELRLVFSRLEAFPVILSLWAVISLLLFLFFTRAKKNLQLLQQRELERAQALSLTKISVQVAHDIRSPLAALDSVVKDVAHLPEDKRIIIRSAVGRIRDIANNLLEKNREIKAGDKNTAAGGGDSATESATLQLLSSLIDPLITEKRLQFRSKIGIEIDSRLDVSSYGLFAKVQPVEFKRTLSNLINNSVEAMNGGSVIVRMSQDDGKVLIKVEDNGKGIPPEILAKLGQRGETHGKAGGSGLGLYHARTSVEKWGGGLEVASESGKGTTITISIPAAKPPEWFVSELRLAANSAVVILDDDTSIHQVWQGRLDSLNVKNSGIEVFHFSTPDDFRNWVRGRSDLKSTVFLADYELIGHKETGLSLAEELSIGSRTILITSRYEEKQILENCIRLKVRMIPKGLAGLVPIQIGVRSEGIGESNKQGDRGEGIGCREKQDVKPPVSNHMVAGHQSTSGKANNSSLPPKADPPLAETTSDKANHSLLTPSPYSLSPAVLIDDDPLVHMTWKISARNKGIAFKAFKKPADFLAANPDTGTAVYVDSDLGDGVKGEEFSKTLFEKGYKTIYLATGHQPESFPPMPHIKKIIGKEPPWE